MSPRLRVLLTIGWALLISGRGAVAQTPARAEKPIKPEDRAHWAFQPPAAITPPTLKPENVGWARNPIDAFILEGLEGAGLVHSPEADRRILLRRLSFDLTGLPPTPEEVEGFRNDRSPGAYERQVDRLLASEQYGVRWAQHWLDLARHADTDGYEFDQARPDAWRYRDWVVSALNRDLPYDRFVTLQMAGDEVAPDDPSAFVATGFHRGYPDMVDLNDQGLRRQNALNDITETTGLVFLGLTIGCARCHDHKFEPLRQTDFYRLQAVFTPAKFRDDYPILSPRDRRSYEVRVASWERDQAKVQAELIALERPIRDRLSPGLPMGALDELVAIHAKPSTARSIKEVGKLFDLLSRDRRIPEARLLQELGPEAASRRRVLLAELDTIRKAAPPTPPRARGLEESSSNPVETFLLIRGEFGQKGQVVGPGFPVVLPGGDRGLKPAPGERGSGRRAALARWMTRPDNPLTYRVIVNRLWQHHFGRGIVATPSDFGLQGSAPSHPELLDWLANELVARGGSLKALHRLMVTSATYRQVSTSNPRGRAVDPENSVFWRQNRLRLDGEAIRDALLAVSGRLNPMLGGPSVFPELPEELTRLSSQGKVWPFSKTPEERDRRSLYVFIRRNLRYPFFEVFDRPDTNASCPSRASSTIAPQSLMLLNSKLSTAAAESLAGRVRRESGRECRSQVERAFVLCFGRPPDANELRVASEFVSEGPESLSNLAIALFNANEFIYVD